MHGALRSALLARILIGLARAAPHHGGALGTPINPRASEETVSAAEAFMSANCHRHISRDEVAEAVSYSPAHVARLFLAVTGQTPGRRLRVIRFERARSLLATSTLPVTQIAGEVGFNSFSHFARVFREESGMTPGEYRRFAR